MKNGKKNMKEKVSIIIPIYKVEKYIRKCIDSVLKQTYNNIEIILVDDGSPDNCPSICDEYAKKDNRIKIIHKKNGGLSDARNYGLDIATGNWITFIDSDDYVTEDYVETLLNLSEINYDIGVILPQYVYEGKINKKNQEKKSKSIILKSVDALEMMLYQKEFDTSAWGKIYKKELFENVRFPKGKLYEDISTIYITFLKSKNVVYYNKKKYMYLQRKDSIMGQKFKVKDMDYITQAEKMLNDIKKISNENLTNSAICRYVNANYSILLKIKRNKKFKKERNEILSNINKFKKQVLFNKNVRLKTKIAIILTYLKLI